MSNEIEVSTVIDSSAVLQTALAEMIQVATSGAEKAGEFLVAEIPDVVQQLLMFYTVMATFWTVLGVILLFSAWNLNKPSRWTENANLNARGTDFSLQGFLSCIIGGVVGGLLGLALFLSNLEDMIKLWIAPKLFLIEYAAGLVK